MVALPFCFPCCGIKRGPCKPFLSLNGGLAPDFCGPVNYPVIFYRLIRRVDLVEDLGEDLIEVLACRLLRKLSFFLDSWTNMPVILIYSKMYPDWYNYIVAWLENLDI